MKLVLLLLIVLSSSTGFACKSGGELGNCFVDYNNKLIGLSVSYPESWKYIALDSAIYFQLSSDSGVTISRRSDVRFMSLGELRDDLQQREPGKVWVERVFDGVPALTDFS